MSVLSKAIAEAGRTAIRSFETIEDMTQAFEQSFQFENQVFYVIGTDNFGSFWKYNGVSTGGIADYTELKLKGKSDLKAVPRWEGGNSYVENDIVNHEGDLYKASQDMDAATNTIAPDGVGARWDLLIQSADKEDEPKIPDWKDTFAYKTNDICAHDGHIWVSQNDENEGSVPTANSSSWLEYKRHFFKNSSPLEIARSMGYILQTDADGNVTPREITQDDLNNLANQAFLRWDSTWKVFYWDIQ